MLKVGDKVRFTGECCDYDDKVCFNDSMKKLLKDGKGKIYTINRVSMYHGGIVLYKLEEIEWFWTDSWIKRAEGTNKIGGKLNEKKKSKD